MTKVPQTLLPLGTLLDEKWRIDALLGKGGMGEVYAATHVRNSASVAVKVLLPEVGHDENVRQRFLHEGYAANQVGHPGTVNILDDGTTKEGLVYLVMERLDGKAIDELADLRGGVLQLPEALALLVALLDVLATAHEKGIVHRDIKPENLFVTTDGRFKVLDFGLARVLEQVGRARLTQEGVPMGTPAFMPPEQASALWDHVDARSDVFSSAASIFTLLTGRLVHNGTAVQQIMISAATRPVPPVRETLTTLPEPIAAVLDRALAYRPDQRFANAGAMRAALANAIGQTQMLLPTLARSATLHLTPSPGPSRPGAPTLQGGTAAATPEGTPPPRSAQPGYVPPGLADARRSESPVATGPRLKSVRGRGMWAAGLVLVALFVSAIGSVFYVRWKRTPSIPVVGTEKVEPPSPSVSEVTTVVPADTETTATASPASASASPSVAPPLRSATPFVANTPSTKPSAAPTVSSAPATAATTAKPFDPTELIIRKKPEPPK